MSSLIPIIDRSNLGMLPYATPPSAQMVEWHKEVAKNSTSNRNRENLGTRDSVTFAESLDPSMA